MPRAFLKTKNRGGVHTYICTKCGKPIEAGQDYYTWKFNRGGRYWQHADHGYPRPSQLSNSKMAQVEDAVHDFDVSGASSPEDIKVSLQDVASVAQDVAQEYTDSADNIESSWPSGNPTSEACRETASALESWVSDLESWEPDNEFDPEQHETQDDWLEECRQAAQSVVDEAPSYAG